MSKLGRRGETSTHTWNDRRVTTSLQLAYCQGFVMYTKGAAVAREQMLSAKMSVWNGPARTVPSQQPVRSG